MDIPIDAEVQCTDGPAGRSICVLLDPVGERITHVVVEEKDFPNTERMVPVEWVAESTPDRLVLRCTREEFSDLSPFLRTEFVVPDEPYREYDEDHYLRWPYIRLADEMRGVEYERIPPGELAIRLGAQVVASDGPVGQVDEFMVDPDSGHITHLVLREGHLWAQRDVAIPVSEIAEIGEDVVLLKLDRHTVGERHAVPARRWHQREKGGAPSGGDDS